MNEGQDLPLRQKILDGLYEKYLKDNRIANTWRYSDCGYVGMDGYCRRKRVYKFHGIIGNITDEQKRVFLRGHLAEPLMLEGLKMVYPGICYQPFPGGLRYEITGRPEIIFSGRTDFYVPPYLVIDGKNISVDAILNEARESHVCQVMMTMAALKQRFGSNFCPQGMVYYQREGRAFDILPFNVPFSRDLVALLEEEVVWLHDNCGRFRQVFDNEDNLVIDDRIPAATEATKYPCSWWNKTAKARAKCDYFDKCWPNFVEPPKTKKRRTR